jgi:aspartokinase
LYFDLRLPRRPQVLFFAGRVRDDIRVLKFGSSVLKSRDDLPTAVHEIYRWYREGWSVVAVVSAIGDTILSS